jgi:hypothetical protein
LKTFENFEYAKFHFGSNPGEIYGDYEKMLLPFDGFTWTGIILVILAGLVVIFIINCFKPSNQELIFGRNNRSPLMNFISIILNGGQANSVVETVPRMLLVLFIFWSLIFR